MQSCGTTSEVSGGQAPIKPGRVSQEAHEIDEVL